MGHYPEFGLFTDEIGDVSNRMTIQEVHSNPGVKD